MSFTRYGSLKGRTVIITGGAGFALQVEKRDLGTVLDKSADKGHANATGAAGDDYRSAFE